MKRRLVAGALALAMVMPLGGCKKDAKETTEASEETSAADSDDLSSVAGDGLADLSWDNFVDALEELHFEKLTIDEFIEYDINPNGNVYIEVDYSDVNDVLGAGFPVAYDAGIIASFSNNPVLVYTVYPNASDARTFFDQLVTQMEATTGEALSDEECVIDGEDGVFLVNVEFTDYGYHEVASAYMHGNEVFYSICTTMDEQTFRDAGRSMQELCDILDLASPYDLDVRYTTMH